MFAIQAVAFVGGLVAVGIVYAIGASVRSRDPILVLVLTGVVVGSLFGAGVGLVKYLADPYNPLPAMAFPPAPELPRDLHPSAPRQLVATPMLSQTLDPQHAVANRPMPWVATPPLPRRSSRGALIALVVAGCVLALGAILGVASFLLHR